MSIQNGKPTLKELLEDTACKHCGEKFHSVRVPVIGQTGRQFLEFTNSLQKHIRDKHPEILTEIVLLAGQFNGMLLLNQFQTVDPQLNEEQDRTRHKIFKLCRRAVVSDSTIEQKVESLPGSNAGLIRSNDVFDLLKEMRDVLSEAGLYPDQPIITVPGSNLPS